MAMFKVDVSGFEALHQAMRNYEGDTEKTINDVLHNEASPLIQDAIKRLMPMSGNRTWKGKKPHAKLSKSLTDTKENLSITVRTTKAYHYLYFPDSGENTRRHVGNQQFFRRGAESQTEAIVDRCINRLINNFEK